ncbi:SET domain-containing protein [Paraburkholderia sp. WSM4175]
MPWRTGALLRYQARIVRVVAEARIQRAMYKGEITRWREAVRRHRREGVSGHTFLFGLSDGRVIDGSRGGTSARWLNHACAPNCETIEDGSRIFIQTLRPIDVGEELFI